MTSKRLIAYTVALCILVTGCQPTTQKKPGVGSLTITFSTQSASKALSMGKAITNGKLEATDTFTFTCIGGENSAGFWIGDSSSSVNNSSVLFRLANSNVSDNFTITPDGTTPLPLFNVTLGGTSSSTLDVINYGTTSGTYDEALFYFITDLYQPTGASGSDYVDYGPRFTVSGVKYGCNGGSTGIADSTESPLYFNGIQLAHYAAGYIYFAPASSGVASAMILDLAPSFSAGENAALDAWLGELHKAGIMNYDTYWTRFFDRYIVNRNTGFGGTFVFQNENHTLFEIVPIDSKFDFGDGTTPVTLAVTYDPSAATYSMGDGTSVPSSALNVVGTPALNFTASIQ